VSSVELAQVISICVVAIGVATTAVGVDGASVSLPINVLSITDASEVAPKTGVTKEKHRIRLDKNTYIFFIEELP
jgi:hypothetical protein